MNKYMKTSTAMMMTVLILGTVDGSNNSAKAGLFDNFELPKIEIPEFEMPEFEMPDLTIPPLGLPGPDMVCAPDYYEDQSLLGIVTITGTFVQETSMHQARGMDAVEQALGGKRRFADRLINDAAQFQGLSGLASSFKNGADMVEFDAETKAMIEALESRPLDTASRKKLEEAWASLHVANRLQVQAVIGLLKTYAMVERVDNKMELAAFLTKNGIADTGAAAGKLTTSLFDMAKGLGRSMQLYMKVDEVLDLDDTQAAIDELGLDIKVDGIGTLALSRAKQLAADYPTVLNQKASGFLIDDLIDQIPGAEQFSGMLGQWTEPLMRTLCGRS